MNILVDKLPNDYEGLKINTNFRSFILFELLMQDSQINKEDKIALALELFYEEFPHDIKKAVNGIIWFYTRGKKVKENKEETNQQNNKKKIYSYEHDSDLIYTAFLDQYRIDLNDIEDLHWFKFKAMVEGLKGDNKICEIMGYRAVDVGKIKDKEEKKKYKKLQREWAFPDERSVDDIDRDFADSLW